MRLRTTCLLCVVCVLFLAAPASADVALYDNGPINGTIQGWVINNGYAVTDSFTLASDSTVTGVNLGTWVYSGDLPLSVDWIISTSNAFDGSTALASGTAADLANAFQGGNFCCGVYLSSFSTGDVHLSAGIYWLLLQNAVTAQGSLMGWDENDGASLAYQNGSQLGSESFQILGTTGTATPEPSSLALFGSGMLLMAGVLRRKLSR